MGRLVARAAEDSVEIVMTDGEDAAVCTMTPDQALMFVSDVLAAAQRASVHVPDGKESS